MWTLDAIEGAFCLVASQSMSINKIDLHICNANQLISRLWPIHERRRIAKSFLFMLEKSNNEIVFFHLSINDEWGPKGPFLQKAK